MVIGALLKQARKDAGLTQKQLGEKCGMADSAIRKYESGRVVPKLDTLQKLATALGQDVSMFLPTKGEDASEYSRLEPYLTEDQKEELASLDQELQREIEYDIETEHEDKRRRLLTAYYKLTQEGQDKAIERVEELAEIPKYKADYSTIDKMVDDYKKKHGSVNG